MTNASFIDNLFDRFLNNPPIIRNHKVLSSSFVPSSLPHRQGQVTELATILVRCLRGDLPSNVLIYGKPGTGKTCVSKLVLNKLDDRLGKDHGQKALRYAFVNCKENSTNYAVYSAISSDLSRLLDSKPIIPPTGLPTGEVYHRLLQQVIKFPSSIIIVVLDEIDELVKKGGSELLYNLTRINTHLENSAVSVIGISNDTKFKDLLDPRVYSSLSEEEIVFTPYKANELADILNERAAEALQAGTIEEGVINKISALAARDHGDARRAIDLLRVSAEISERQGDLKITVKHVDEAKSNIERNVVFEVASSLPLHSKLVLAAIYLIDSQSREEATTGMVYELYSEFCTTSGLEVVSSRRVSDYINEQDQLGLISADVISKGRYGRTKRIALNVSKQIIFDVLRRDLHTAPILASEESIPLEEAIPLV